MKDNLTGLFVLVLFFITYLYTIFLIIKRIKKLYRITRLGTKTLGRIVSISEESDGDNRTIYYPFIEFIAHNGEKIVFKSNLGSYKKSTYVEFIEVIYYKKNPVVAEVNKKKILYIELFILFLSNLSCFSVTIFMFSTNELKF